MTTKILSGTYSSGYTLAAAYTGVIVTSTGAVTNASGAYPGGAASVSFSLPNGGALSNHGSIQGASGGAGQNVDYYLTVNYYTGRYYLTYTEHAGPGGNGGAGVVASAQAQITNFATIQGGSGGVGGNGGASMRNGGAGYYYEIGGAGGDGVDMLAGGRLTNRGTIGGGAAGQSIYGGGGGVGVYIAAGGNVTNGSLTNRTALIEGSGGVDLTGTGTVTNFSTIEGGIEFGSASDVLIAEGGSTFIGAVVGGGGTLELRAGGTGTIDGIGGFGRVTFATGASWVFQGDNEIPTGLTVHAGSTIAVEGTLATHGVIAADVTVAGELAVAGGAVLSLIGGTLTNLAGGTLTGGTFAVGAGERLQLPDNAAIATLNATIELLGAKAGVQSLDTKSGQEIGLRSSLTTIGAAGVLDIAGGASFASFNAIANAGTIEALGGTVTIAGAVIGTGTVQIGGGGMATLAGAFAENVGFAAGAGELKLGTSQGYTGTISGLTAADTLDLADIAFKSAKASFSGTTAGGVLTVTDGVHTANIHLAGDYTASTWTLSSDGHGGTKVVDPPAGASPLATAIAGFAPAAAASPTLAPTAYPPSLAHLIAAPRSAMAL